MVSHMEFSGSTWRDRRNRSMDMYIDQCEENKDYEKKLKFMSILFTSIDMNKFDEKIRTILSIMMFMAFIEIYSFRNKIVYLEGKNIDIKKVNDFFDIYTKKLYF